MTLQLYLYTATLLFFLFFNVSRGCITFRPKSSSVDSFLACDPGPAPTQTPTQMVDSDWSNPCLDPDSAALVMSTVLRIQLISFRQKMQIGRGWHDTAMRFLLLFNQYPVGDIYGPRPPLEGTAICQTTRRFQQILDPRKAFDILSLRYMNRSRSFIWRSLMTSQFITFLNL